MLIQKHQKSGKVLPIVGSANPKDWFVNVYKDSEFSNAFANARNNGDKEFMWKGKRYNTNLIPKEQNTKLLNDIKFMQDYYNTLDPNSIQLNKQDSLSAQEHGPKIIENLMKQRDSLQEQVNHHMTNYKSTGDQQHLKKANDTKAVLDKHNERLKRIKEDQGGGEIFSVYKDSIANHYRQRANNLSNLGKDIIPTTQPNKGDDLGYYDFDRDKIYINMNENPYTSVHEFDHYVTAKRPRPTKVGSYQINTSHSPDYIKYITNPLEVGGRNMEARKLLYDKGIPMHQTIDQETYLKNKGELIGGSRSLLFNSYKLFKDNFNYKDGNLIKRRFKKGGKVKKEQQGGTARFIDVPDPQPSDTWIPVTNIFSEYNLPSNLNKPAEQPVTEVVEEKEYSFIPPQIRNSSKKPENKTWSSNKDFVNDIRPVLSKALQNKGLDTKWTDYLVSQAALESGWGKSPSGSYNLTGIKGKGKTVNTKEYLNGEWKNVKDSFRNFKSLDDWADQYVGLLNNQRYGQAFTMPEDEFISYIHKAGYATDPDYVSKVNSVLKRVKSYGK